MTLADVIRADRVVIPLDQPTLREAAGALAEYLSAAGVVKEPDKLKTRVDEERGEDIVSLAGRAFIAHYRTDAVEELVLAIGVAREPIVREIGESEQARVVVLLLAPPRLAARHLQLLGLLDKTLSREATIDELTRASTAEAVASLPAFRQAELAPQLVVRDIMMERPRTTRPDSLLRDAARDMARAGISAMPVVESNGLLVGLLSERELMRHLLSVAALGAGTRHPGPPSDAARRSVRDVMTRQVICVSPDQPVAEVASFMSNKDVDGVPVVHEGRLVGFLTRSDIVRKMLGV